MLPYHLTEAPDCIFLFPRGSPLDCKPGAEVERGGGRACILSTYQVRHSIRTLLVVLVTFFPVTLKDKIFPTSHFTGKGTTYCLGSRRDASLEGLGSASQYLH